MKTAGWIALTLVFLVASALVAAWPDLRDLDRSRIWSPTAQNAPEGELQGVRVFIDESRAMILPGLPDRALIFLRLGVQGDPEVMADWLGCDIALTDSSGRDWLPLLNLAGLMIIDTLGDEDEVDNQCGQSLIFAENAATPSLSVQAFLVPVAVLNDLRLEVSGMTVRPDGLSLPFTPSLRPPPA